MCQTLNLPPRKTGRFPHPLQPPPKLPSSSYAAGPLKPLPKAFQGATIFADTKRKEHTLAMTARLPLTIGFARVSQATEDQGNLETQTQQL